MDGWMDRWNVKNIFQLYNESRSTKIIHITVPLRPARNEMQGKKAGDFKPLWQSKRTPVHFTVLTQFMIYPLQL